MDFGELIESHIESRADITIAAQPVTPGRRDPDGHLPLRRRRADCQASRKSRTDERLAEMAAARRADRWPAARPPTSRSSPRWASTSSRATCCSRSSQRARHRLRQGDHPEGARDASGAPVHLPRLLGGRRHDRSVLRRQHPAHAARRPVQLLPPPAPDLHAPALPAGNAHLRLPHRYVHHRRRLLPRQLRGDAIRSSASAPTFSPGAQDHALGPARRRLLRGGNGGARKCPLGIGRNVVLDRVIVDKNARIGDGVRLVNEQGIQDADGDGYYIRSGIIIVPKGARIQAGVSV